MGSGNYFYPIKREFLNLSGGTVTGDTLFTANLSATTIFSGSSNLADIIYSSITGGTKVSGGINTFTAGTPLNTSINITGASLNDLYTSGITQFWQASATTFSGTNIYANSEISPIVDNNTDIGTPLKRFRSLYTVSGVSVFFTATTRVYTPEIQLGNTLVYENNIVLTGDTIGGIDVSDW